MRPPDTGGQTRGLISFLPVTDGVTQLAVSILSRHFQAGGRIFA